MKSLKTTSIIFLFLFLLTLKLFSQEITDNAKISILTCGPGKELYSAFGHSAIRVQDNLIGIDYVYNYGTFNFAAPNFYLKFAGGRLDYFLKTLTYNHFIQDYITEKRWVKEQVLSLNFQKKTDIFNFLQKNALPENKYYRYDFFFDNCATRIKDVLKQTLKENLILGNSETNNESFRELYTKYLKYNKWGRFGINLGLGSITDRVVTNEESSFLPDYLSEIIKNPKLVIDGKTQNLVKEEVLLFMPEETSKDKTDLFSPEILFWSILLIFVLIFIYEEIKKRHFILIDKFVFFIFGILGVLLLVLWTATDHSTVVNNWNLIWAIPTHFIVTFFINKKKSKLLKVYFYFSLFLGICGLVFCLVNILPQEYDPAFFPIILLLVLRSYRNI